MNSQSSSPTPIQDDFDFHMIRGAAITMVIIIHVVAPCMYEFSLKHVWSVANAADSLARPAVPLFLMVSGALLLLSKKLDESKGLFFSKRLARLLIPIIFWICFYLWWRCAKGEHITLPLVMSELIKGTVYYHIPFIYYLVGGYLATPILRHFVRQSMPSDLNYFLVVWFVCVSIFPLLIKFAHLPIILPFSTGTALIGYFILGHKLRELKVGSKTLSVVMGLGALGAFITISGTYLLTKTAGGTLDEFFYEYTSAGVVLLSAAYFLVLRYLSPVISRKRGSEIIRSLSANSFGIYLLHPLILECFANRLQMVPTLVRTLLMSCLVLSASWVIVSLMRRTPLLARTVS